MKILNKINIYLKKLISIKTTQLLLVKVVVIFYGPYKPSSKNFVSFSPLLTAMFLYLLSNSIINILFSINAKCCPMQFLEPALKGM
jgi:hypothetical protein